MPKITDEELVRVHIRLFKKDYDKLQKLFGDNIKRTTAIRTAVRMFVNKIDADAAARIDEIEREYSE